MIKMMIVASLLYGILQLPKHAMYIYMQVKEYEVYNGLLLWNCFILLGVSSSCYNPIIYAWMNRQYRIGFVQALGPMCPAKWRLKYRSSVNQRSNLYKVEERTVNPQPRDLQSSSSQYCAANAYKK
ncbi:hypothetical protein Ciccas_013499 [Cichlidogyrus casuarinus]|uniref:G-protein coupled receptors family 1 profile domain-containing protein n=1 Tax=Cichlidogyrus casuarinus TaxID=1844966 RepID=A0ABD2PNH8_9PLAT